MSFCVAIAALVALSHIYCGWWASFSAQLGVVFGPLLDI